MVLDTKKIEEIRKQVPKLLDDGILVKKDEHQKLVPFYMELVMDSLHSAQLLYKVSTDSKLQSLVGFPNLKGFLWVINASYYSMFYMANALLASSTIKIKSEMGVHSLTFKAFTYYFYLTNKISKKYVEEFFEALQDSEELLGKEEIIKKAEEKAKGLVLDLNLEREKRRTFTYQLEKTRIEAKAKTSLERAKHFFQEVERMMEK
jgi:uncharacterized protein (UPF0332 family)